LSDLLSVTCTFCGAGGVGTVSSSVACSSSNSNGT
ncbi:hypothetical protein A2U01_0070515, partial [Trifolium medium]|nr:hypothetical protein [Trifolium medium]